MECKRKRKFKKATTDIASELSSEVAPGVNKITF